MKNPMNTKKAGVGVEQGQDPAVDRVQPMGDMVVVHSAEPDATPPDIIVE